MTRYFTAAVILLLAAGSAFAQSKAKAQNVAEIPYTSVPNFLKLPPDLYLGEAMGVATNSKGHIFVFTRSANTRLFEFDQNGNYVREIGQGLYGFEFAHSVRVDPQDNIWVVDEGTNMIIKFNPAGRVMMVLGRRPEFATQPIPTPPGPTPPPEKYEFRRPTDVAWDPQGNIFISDGYVNERVVKFDKNGRFLKQIGSEKPGNGIGQFNLPHGIAIDAQGLVYVADRNNKRIQVFDGDGNFKTQFTDVGTPAALCITPGPHQYLCSSNSNPPNDIDVAGEIYKMELDGRIVGTFGRAGRMPKEFGDVNAMDCRSDNAFYVAEMITWRVQKLSLHPQK